MWKERQKRDYCRANGLCYWCNEKYDPAHAEVCTKRPKAQANALSLNNLDVDLNENILAQLELEDALSQDFGQLSLNALAGTSQGQAMRVRALVKNKVMLLLVDSGSSHSFISSSFLHKIGIPSVPCDAKTVKMANGSTLLTDHIVPALEWWSNGHTITTPMRVLDLDAYDAILGYAWLQSNSPMVCDWEARTIEFEQGSKKIKLQGVPTPPPTLNSVTLDTFCKWVQGNEVWAIALVEPVTTKHSLPPPTSVDQVLDTYADVFQDPKTLPPKRIHDHPIPLQPGTTPVNSRPYRYSPLHKNEIERQIRELLQAGLITHSTSPFASLVLLVQKKGW